MKFPRVPSIALNASANEASRHEDVPRLEPQARANGGTIMSHDRGVPSASRAHHEEFDCMPIPVRTEEWIDGSAFRALSARTPIRAHIFIVERYSEIYFV